MSPNSMVYVSGGRRASSASTSVPAPSPSSSRCSGRPSVNAHSVRSSRASRTLLGAVSASTRFRGRQGRRLALWRTRSSFDANKAATTSPNTTHSGRKRGSSSQAVTTTPAPRA